MSINEFTPNLGPTEISKVVQVLEDNWITEGKCTRMLEQRLAAYFDCKHVLMVPNGTLALFAALKVLGVGPGDEVIVPDFTFFGSASAVELTGATPVLVDVDLETGNIDIEAAEAAMSDRVKAIMPVHIFGRACDMEAVTAFKHRHDLLMVEDAAQGMGVRYRGQHVGTFGEVGCLSFFADKTMTTGEGGALLINDDTLAERAMYFKNQGRLHRGTFVHDQIGYNFRITDLQAAIGLAQFDRLGETIARKHDMLQQYTLGLQGCPGVQLPQHVGDTQSVPFRVTMLVDDPAGLADYLREAGIATRRFFYPLHLQPGLAGIAITRRTPVNSMHLFEAGLMLPSGLQLSADDVEMVCQAVWAYQTRHAPAEADAEDAQAVLA